MRIRIPQVKEIYLFSFLFVYSFLLRIKSILSPTEIDWDESTFITVAQRLFRHGELPFTSTFEVKPPLAYIFFGIPSFFGAEALWIYRIFATFLISIVAYILTKIVIDKSMLNFRIMIGLLCITLYSVLPAGMAWMTELNTLPILILIYVFINKTSHRRYAVLVGILAGMLVLTRTNMGLVLAAVILSLVDLKDLRNTIKRIFSVIMGFLIPIGVVVITYSLYGSINELWRGAVVLPKAIINSTDPLDFQIGITILSLVVVSIFPLAIGGYIQQKKRNSLQKFKEVSFLHLAVILGVFLSHPMYGHHLLQLTFLPIISLIILYETCNTRIQQVLKKNQNEFTSTLSIFCLLLTFIATSEIPRLDPDKSKYVQREELVKQVSVLFKNNESGTIWSPNETMVYYRLNLKPAYAIMVHPVNLVTPSIRYAFKGSVSSFRESFASIIASRPDVVILSEYDSYFTLQETRTILNWLDQDYLTVNATTPGYTIYKKIV